MDDREPMQVSAKPLATGAAVSHFNEVSAHHTFAHSLCLL